VAMIRAYHRARGDLARNEIIVPEAAHGTNPATATMCGCVVREVPVDDDGDVDIEALKSVVGPNTAGIMLTNPSTLGVFERRIQQVARIVHEAGGLLYYDGANLNAILGVTRPGDMGFDIVHMNLHKTFAVPHGGGGPGAGPVAVSARLAPYLPGPVPVRDAGGDFAWATPERSIGRVHGWYGNALALARAYAYLLANGGDGLRRVAEGAVLNANWVRHRLRGHYDIPFDRPCMHECVVSATSIKKRTGVKALDVAKRLLEEGFHAPTVYFPLIIDEALMIEPTETETIQTLEALTDALIEIADGASADDKEAPRSTPVRRLDEARAARSLIATYDARLAAEAAEGS
jgi:glycine dehydrogenase subunit 2